MNNPNKLVEVSKHRGFQQATRKCGIGTLCRTKIFANMLQGERAQLNARVMDNLIAKLDIGLITHERYITELVLTAGEDIPGSLEYKRVLVAV